MMTVQEFLEHIRAEKNDGYSVLFFIGKDYPLLFFSQLFSFFSRKNQLVRALDMSALDTLAVKAEIATMSFSGQILYWLYGMHMLSVKKQQEWAEYLCSYTGPHQIICFFIDEHVKQIVHKRSSLCSVLVSEQVAVQDLSKFYFLVSNDQNSRVNAAFISGISSYVSHVSLDNACLLTYYEIVLGKSIHMFLREWLMHIIEPSHSLFLLSQYFFAKKTKFFFEQWALCSELYMAPFWISYWADQVWRAYVYCDLMKHKKYTEAKKVQYKLPFSLINRDWSSLQLNELRNAHHFLTVADYKIKNGGSDIVLELFFYNFFEHTFVQQ